jgi:predicted outer membrane repeat protein/parallel beta-helix repeat protein
VEPTRDNPFDAENEITSGDPFNLQTQNLSDHIRISWEYSFETPIPESYQLYRIDSFGLDTIYMGTNTTFQDNMVTWDSTYSYYVTAIINNKESLSPEVNELPKVTRRIYVGEGMGYTNIENALEIVDSGNVVYVMPGLYMENIDFMGKKFKLLCNGEAGSCILDGDGNGTVVTFSGGEDSSSVLDGFTITGGSSYLDGGGIVVDSDPLIQNCIFTGNITTDSGGAIMIERKTKPIIRGCTFSGNQAGGDGGAIFCDRDSQPIIEDCIFNGNSSSTGNGGAIAIDDASPTITNCTFNGNLAMEGSGGALSLSDLRGMNINNSQFISNTAKKGGAVYIYDAKDVEFTQCSFESNSADFGGGIYIDDSGMTPVPISFINCILWKNSAYGGGGIYSDESVIAVTYCTVSGNSASQNEGGGLYCKNSSEATIINSIYWQNTADVNPEVYYDGNSMMTITYSDITGGFTGEGNLNANPLFEDANNGDFHLQESSPCIGTGQAGTNMGAYGGAYGNW